MYALNHKFFGVIVIVISHGSLLCHHTSYNLQTSHEHLSSHVWLHGEDGSIEGDNDIEM
jgi:hypothetical protein